MGMEMSTDRLRLVNADALVLGAALDGNQSLGTVLAVNVQEGWTEFGTGPITYVADLLRQNPDEAPWWTWLPILRQENKLIGSGGFRGRPNAEGEVEIGYEIAPEHREQGLATEMALALRDAAFRHPEVRKVIAHTLPELNPSVRVLQHCGMVKTGESTDPDEGTVWRWEITRERYESGQALSPAYPPMLLTERIMVRPLSLEEVPHWTEFLNNAEATALFPPDMQPSPDRAQQWIERQLQRYITGQYGLAALIHRETGEFLGQCGLLAQVIDDQAELEVGYHLMPQHWHQGYATEAARAFRDWGFEHGLADSIISIINRLNLPSQAVATRNGMQREKATVWREIEVYVYRITRQAWERSRQVAER